MGANPVLRAQQVGKRFDDQWVVRGIEFDVAPGTIFGLFGPSGAGKTTTLRLLLGLLSPDEGALHVLGRTPSDFDGELRCKIGYMPQLFVLYPELSVRENLDLVASLYGLGWWGRRKRIQQVLDFVDLEQHQHKTARHLSGGMLRRVELAAALLHEPELLIVDEPTAGIDPILRVRLWDQFRELRDSGRTVVVTSQYVTEAEYCDEVAVLGHGRLVARGTPAELRRQAFGGEVIDVRTDGLAAGIVDRLMHLEGVRSARQLSMEQVQLTVHSAADAIPLILATLSDAGIIVRQAQELRPNFDEVFVRLLADD